MRKSVVDSGRLLAAAARLGDAVIDPTIWREILAEISTAASATGAVLLQSDVRTTDVPVSSGASEVVAGYFANGWHKRDVRAERAVPLLLRGETVITDQDIFTPEDLRSLGFYTDHLSSFGFQWFAVVGFWSGSALWGLSIQRKASEGPFDHYDKRALGQISRRLTEVATLSKAVGRATLLEITNALDLVDRPAVALDRLGFVVGLNISAQEILNDDFHIRDGRLYTRDEKARALLNRLVDQMKGMPDTVHLDAGSITVQRRYNRPLILRIVPVNAAARNPFLGARVLVILSDLETKRSSRPELLSLAFGLSKAEAKLASLISSGVSLGHAAEELQLARETVRNQLKSIFAKTETHRQAELVALLSRL